MGQRSSWSAWRGEAATRSEKKDKEVQTQEENDIGVNRRTERRESTERNEKIPVD